MLDGSPRWKTSTQYPPRPKVRRTAWHMICDHSGMPSTYLEITLALPDQKALNRRPTGAIVNVNVVRKIFSIVLCRCSDIAAERGASKTGSCVRNIPRILECFVSRMQQNTLLRVHTPRFPWRELEKFVIEIGKISQEIACFNLCLVRE